MPFLHNKKNRFLKKHYQKQNIHPQQFQPIIDPNLQSLIQWVIYVGRWMPGSFGTYSRLVDTIWTVYKGYYEDKSMEELFMITIAGLSKSKTKRFILRKFSSSFAHIFSSPQSWNKKPETKYLPKSKKQQLSQIQSHENQIKNYILSQIQQKYGKHIAQKVQSKYGDNWSEIMASAIMMMALQGKDQKAFIKQLPNTKQKKYCFF